MEQKPVVPAEESGKKLQQSGGAGAGSVPVLSGDAYTHGGVKKTKFEPKVPTRRLKKLSATVKDEPGEGLGDGEIPKELHRLLQQAENAGRGVHRPDRRDPGKVAFGFGGFSSRSTAPTSGFQQRGSGGSGGGRGGGGGGSRGVEKQEFMQADGIGVDSKKGIRKNVEVFDLERYYPVTLPLRRPSDGDSRLLDEEEFGDEVDAQEEDEDAVEPAQELDLQERKDEDMLFFFQLPKGLPLSLNPSGKEKKVLPGSAKLEDLGKGAMGKLLVYESGAVKFKVGDVIFDALPGTECTFAQELAAVNTSSKRCGFLGEVNKRVVLTPDISNVLPDMTDLSTKS